MMPGICLSSEARRELSRRMAAPTRAIIFAMSRADEAAMAGRLHQRHDALLAEIDCR